MTAIVGVLNKRGVAIAADSAVTVTVGDNTKIYNTSQKIFPLSEKNPIAVMTFDKASFMDVPCGVLIDLYRKERGNKSFATVQDYAKDFIAFIGNSEHTTGKEGQRNYRLREMLCVYNRLTDAVKARADEEIDSLESPSDEKKAEVIQRHRQEVDEEFSNLCAAADKVGSAKYLSYKRFLRLYDDDITYLISDILGQKWPEEEREKWSRHFYRYLTSQFIYNATGLVFIGFGKKEIYPSSYAIVVSGVFKDSLRWHEYDQDAITNDHSSLILPFAQTDVMMTMMKGIAPSFYEQLIDSHKASLSTAKERMLAKMAEMGIPQQTINQFNDMDFDDIHKEYVDKSEAYIDENYINGIVDAVASFNIEDMANMAESLISITALRRHISLSEESVGGPVEVAVITRESGFQWVKHRKWPPV